MLGLLLAATIAIPTGGPHDFDFEFGNWNAQVSRLVHGADGSKTWIKMHGTHDVTKLWNGRANVGVFELDGPNGHLEGMQVRLYDPKARTWSLTFANSSVGRFQPPSAGGFSGGRGVFYDRETEGGKTTLTRSVTTVTSPTSYRDEGATSSDGERPGRSTGSSFIRARKGSKTWDADRALRSPMPSSASCGCCGRAPNPPRWMS